MTTDTTAELNARLLNLIDWIGQTGKELESGIRAQAPELAREMIALEVWRCWLFMSVGCLVGAAFMIVGRILWVKVAAFAKVYGAMTEPERIRVYPPYGWRPDSVDAMGVFRILLPCVGAVVILAVVLPNVADLLKVTVAPRVYLIETASKWIHGGGR